MGDEYPSDRFLSVPAAYFWNNMIELLKFQMAIAKHGHLMSRAQLELTKTIMMLGPEVSKKLFATSTFSALAEATSKGVKVGEIVTEHDPLSDELTFCRVVDNYLLYVSELLALIFRTKPEALKSDEKVSIEMILGHTSLEDLIESLTERRVLGLSLKGIFALNNYLKRRLSFALIEDPALLKVVVEIVENRNLYVHNRGIVNRHYLNRVPDTPLKLGERLIPREETRRAMWVLAELVFITDGRAADKFHIPQPERAVQVRAPILGF